MIENELAKMESRIKADLAQMGVSFEDYLKHMKKDLSAWKESEKESAKKQVVIQLALHAIGKAENIKVSDEAVHYEVAHLMAQYKDVDKERATAYSEERMNNSFVAEYIFTGKVPDEKELFGSHEGHNH
jgi:FKBP-type peptidyl-prolyl cis-trans isomerase (trigger factor)